jgi:hypothetical protein
MITAFVRCTRPIFKYNNRFELVAFFGKRRKPDLYPKEIFERMEEKEDDEPMNIDEMLANIDTTLTEEQKARVEKIKQSFRGLSKERCK